MGFIRDCIEWKEDHFPLNILDDGRAIYSPNNALFDFLRQEENDRSDVVYVMDKIRQSFNAVFWVRFSIIEWVRVRMIVEDVLSRIRTDWRDVIPPDEQTYSPEEFWRIWKRLSYGWIVDPGDIEKEVFQRVIFEVFGVPIECDRLLWEIIPQSEKIMLLRERERRNNPFTTEDYKK